MTAPILIMAGGTGGHVFPALAVARALRGRNEEVVWLGTRQGIEADLVPREGIPLEWTRVAGLRGKGWLTWILAPLKLLIAVFDALAVVIRRRPKVVLGMGGFAAGPGGLAAWLLRKPLVIHEQNSIAGLTNRLLAGLAREVLEAFPGSFSAGKRARLVGNPVRADIVALPDPGHRLSGHQGRLRVLVLGGSQGARVLNEIGAVGQSSVCSTPDEQCGCLAPVRSNPTFDALRSECLHMTPVLNVRARPRLSTMSPSAYGWADIVICRAGALTISRS